MQLKVRDVAELLNVSEKTIYRWVKEGNLPAYRVSEQLRFNRVEILEWATSRKIAVPSSAFTDSDDPEPNETPVSEALRNGGIAYRVAGASKEVVIRDAVNVMRLPDKVDRAHLLEVILARESMASTAIGDGIAIPHVRYPIVLHIARPIIALCFLENPVEFKALDGKPVHCLFMMVSPTVRTHLQIISRLAFVLQDEGFKAVIQRQGLREEIFSELARIETKMGWSSTEKGEIL
jgi:PTS system nitrogen regulatory IIA component